MDKTTKVMPTKVSPIDWKKSYDYHPRIVIPVIRPVFNSEHYESWIYYESDINNDTIQMSTNHLVYTEDETLLVLLGCLREGSNFKTVLKEYYGEEIYNVKNIQTQIPVPNAKIEVLINENMTAFEAKVAFLENAVKTGYAHLFSMTPDEMDALGIPH